MHGNQYTNQPRYEMSVAQVREYLHLDLQIQTQFPRPLCRICHQPILSRDSFLADALGYEHVRHHWPRKVLLLTLPMH